MVLLIPEAPGWGVHCTSTTCRWWEIYRSFGLRWTKRAPGYAKVMLRVLLLPGVVFEVNFWTFRGSSLEHMSSQAGP